MKKLVAGSVAIAVALALAAAGPDITGYDVDDSAIGYFDTTLATTSTSDTTISFGFWATNIRLQLRGAAACSIQVIGKQTKLTAVGGAAYRTGMKAVTSNLHSVANDSLVIIPPCFRCFKGLRVKGVGVATVDVYASGGDR